jgi:hypothetical protein
MTAKGGPGNRPFGVMEGEERYARACFDCFFSGYAQAQGRFAVFALVESNRGG